MWFYLYTCIICWVIDIYYISMDHFNLLIIMLKQIRLCLFIIWSQERCCNTFQITTKVPFWCKRSFDGRISNSKLAIHAKCYEELRKMDNSVRNIRNKRNESLNNGIMTTHLDEWKMCYHRSLKDLQAKHTWCIVEVKRV